MLVQCLNVVYKVMPALFQNNNIVKQIQRIILLCLELGLLVSLNGKQRCLIFLKIKQNYAGPLVRYQ